MKQPEMDDMKQSRLEFFAKVGRLASQALGAVHVAGIIWVCQ